METKKASGVIETITSIGKLIGGTEKDIDVPMIEFQAKVKDLIDNKWKIDRWEVNEDKKVFIVDMSFQDFKRFEVDLKTGKIDELPF